MSEIKCWNCYKIHSFEHCPECIQYGEVDLLDKELDFKNGEILVSTMIPMELEEDIRKYCKDNNRNFKDVLKELIVEGSAVLIFKV